MFYENIIQAKGGVIAGTTLRKQNNKDFNLRISENNNLERLQNRKMLFDSLSFKEENAIFVKQTHTDNVFVLEKHRIKKQNNEYDALLTKDKHSLLCITTGDCCPIFIYDKANKAIGIAHAGWRGTKKNIIIKTIKTLIENFGSKKDNITLSFGPTIGICCYQVSSDFISYFPDSVEKRNGNVYLDLIKENTNQAKSIGIPKENILTASYLCTHCNNNLFYSHRKENQNSKEVGRMVSFIAIEQKAL